MAEEKNNRKKSVTASDSLGGRLSDTIGDTREDSDEVKALFELLSKNAERDTREVLEESERMLKTYGHLVEKDENEETKDETRGDEAASSPKR